MFILNAIVWIYTKVIEFKCWLCTRRINRATNKMINSYKNMNILGPYKTWKNKVTNSMERLI